MKMKIHQTQKKEEEPEDNYQDEDSKGPIEEEGGVDDEMNGE